MNNVSTRKLLQLLTAYQEYVECNICPFVHDCPIDDTPCAVQLYDILTKETLDK